MKQELILCVDDVLGELKDHKVYVLKMVGEGIYEFTDIPLFMRMSKKEFQMRVGVFVYRLDVTKDREIIDKYFTHVKQLEQFDDLYTLIKLYDRSNIAIKNTNKAINLDSELNTNNKRFVYYDDVPSFIPNAPLHVLKKNEDETISISNIPIAINTSLKEYQFYNDVCLAFEINKDSFKYINDKNIIFELEPTDYQNKYNYIQVYKKDKILVKQSNISLHKEV